MSKELFEKRNKLTYDLRQALDKWESDNNRPTNEFDVRANSLLKEQVERLEKDLDQVEAQLSRSQIADKHAKREAELARPEFETRGALKSNSSEEEYAKRFGEALFSGNRVGLERVMSERTDITTAATNSTSAIPTIWQNRIVEKVNQFNVVRGLCPIKNVVGDQKIVLGGALPTAYKVTEGSAVTVDSTFAVSNIDVLDLTYAVYLPITKQYQTDAIGGLDYVARKAGEALANKLEDEYTNGAGGSGNMPGLFAAGFSAYDTGITSTFTLANWATKTAPSDDLIELAHTVLPQYRSGGVYMMNDATAKTVRKFKDTTNQYIWKNPDRYSDVRDGMPSTIYGYPVYINQQIASPGTNGDKFMLFFNPNYYEIYDRNGGVDVMIDPYGLSTNLMTRVVVSHRTYGVCTNTSAGAVMTI